VGRVEALATVDAAGGSGRDSFAWAIGWRDPTDGRAIVARLGEQKPPFDPQATVKAIVNDLTPYGVTTVTGDAYSGDWVQSAFRRLGVNYIVSEKNRSELYVEALPVLTSRRCELPDHPKLLAQFSQLQRRSGATGKDAIDHRRGQHDDLSNV